MLAELADCPSPKLQLDVNPAAWSTGLGSAAAPVNDTDSPQNWVRAPPPDATGGAFVTVTVLRYSRTPPSRSRIFPPTARVPLSVVGQDPDATFPNGPYP